MSFWSWTSSKKFNCYSEFHASNEAKLVLFAVLLSDSLRWKARYSHWVTPEKIHTPMMDGIVFNTPSHLDFLKHKTPSCLDFQEKRPPSRLDFWGKIVGLNLIYF